MEIPQAPPRLFHFNATCEMEVANALASYTAPAFLRQFEQELDFVPFFLACKQDYLLLNKIPSNKFLDQLSALKYSQAQLCTQEAFKQILQNGAKLNALTPWGWSPAEHRFLQEYKKYCSSDFQNQSVARWKQEHRELYSRRMALQVLKNFINESNSPELFISQQQLPQICTCIQQVEALINKWNSIVVKSPWSSSGRGLILLYKGALHDTYKKWINGVIKSQGFVMVEVLLNKVCDLSFHFEVLANKEIRFLGQASFSTTEGGQYIGNNVQAMPKGLQQEEYDFVCNEHIDLIQQELCKALLKSPIYNKYTGVLGVDVLLYLDEYGKLRFQPCLEINLRQNMGTVALAIRACLPKNVRGMWQVKYLEDNNKNASIGFDAMMQKKHPKVIDNGQIIKGYLPLVEPYEGRKFALYLVVD